MSGSSGLRATWPSRKPSAAARASSNCAPSSRNSSPARCSVTTITAPGCHCSWCTGPRGPVGGDCCTVAGRRRRLLHGCRFRGLETSNRATLGLSRQQPRNTRPGRPRLPLPGAIGPAALEYRDLVVLDTRPRGARCHRAPQRRGTVGTAGRWHPTCPLSALRRVGTHAHPRSPGVRLRPAPALAGEGSRRTRGHPRDRPGAWIARALLPGGRRVPAAARTRSARSAGTTPRRSCRCSNRPAADSRSSPAG